MHSSIAGTWTEQGPYNVSLNVPIKDVSLTGSVALVAMLWPTQKEKYPYVALQGQRGACIARVFDHKNRLMFDEGVRWHLSSGDAIKDLKYALEKEATRKGLMPETRHVRMPDSSGVNVVKKGKDLSYVRRR
jgi:hypothetical protein